MARALITLNVVLLASATVADSLDVSNDGSRCSQLVLGPTRLALRYSHNVPAKRSIPTATNHLQAFFDKYPGFTYNCSNPATSEFHRLAGFLHWPEPERYKCKRLFRNALVKEFERIYGRDENLESWQTLYRVLNISPIPGTLKGCRKKIQGIFVNLVDLVDLPNAQEPIKLFEDEKALSSYTLQSGKCFPEERARASGLLKVLLRNIFNPQDTRRRSRAQRRRGGF
ncbi:hypothetical protein Hypma_003621 [Hypsizygus marmoreus]|uniref:Uncharacterized protein n=1 Tax=Hypsizygus marmoreus TaxID=39966 RepID=A0A369J7Y0_HYPMA|nr:hypothetical protein Hypma_003621 [Hypsizygus marmoreus]